jgi:hypothetical protein
MPVLMLRTDFMLRRSITSITCQLKVNFRSRQVPLKRSDIHKQFAASSITAFASLNFQPK